jgi:pentalenic acid synthase
VKLSEEDRLTAFVTGEVTPAELRAGLAAAQADHPMMVLPQWFVVRGAGSATEGDGGGRAGAPESAAATEAESALAAAVVAHCPDVVPDLTMPYLPSGGTVIQTPAIIDTLAARGFTGIIPADLLGPLPLRAVARKLRAQPPELPLSRECPHHPPKAYGGLRARGPVTEVRIFDGRTAWAVTGHTEVRSLLADRRLSVDRDEVDYPTLARVLTAMPPQRREVMKPLLATDPPVHTEQRRALLPSFTLQRVRTLRPVLAAAADALLDELVSGADLVGAYARPFVAAGAAALLGLRGEDAERLRTLLTRHFDPIPELVAFIADLLRDPGPTLPGPGLLNELRDQIAAGTLPARDAAHYVTVILMAGQDITVNTIALAVTALLTYPAQLHRLRTGEIAWPDAVEELLRFLSLTGGLVRVATADIAVAGEVIRAGDAVVLLNPAANRDPAVFERPHELDLGRSARRHLSFGFGVHQCIGHNLARLDVEVALRRLLTRFPGLRLPIPVERLPVRQGVVFGLRALPVAW